VSRDERTRAKGPTMRRVIALARIIGAMVVLAAVGAGRAGAVEKVVTGVTGSCLTPKLPS
jgi:hypothetical protein